MKRKFSPLDVPRAGFGLLSIFDWITPLSKMAEVAEFDPPFGRNSWTFFIPNTRSIHAGYSKTDIKRLLNENGIPVYGDMTSFGEITFRVPIVKAARAEAILNKYGVPIQPRSQGAPRR